MTMNKISILLRRWVLLLILSTSLFIPYVSVQAAAIFVNTDIAGGGCTLIDAINTANANEGLGGCLLTTVGEYGDDTIILTAEQSVNTLTEPYDHWGVGLPRIESKITIQGIASFPALIQRAQTVAGEAAPKFGIFAVTADGNLTLENIRITGGHTDRTGGAIDVLGGKLRLVDSAIERNRSTGGGGIDISSREGFHASVSIERSLIADNIAYEVGSGGGGGLKIQTQNGSASLYVTDSTISGNDARAGGVFIGGGDVTVTIINSTITDNHNSYDIDSFQAGGVAISGGGDEGTVVLRNNIISGNTNSILYGGDEVRRITASNSTVTMEFNVIGHQEFLNAMAVEGFLYSPSNIFATPNGGSPTPLRNIIGLLENNGRPIRSHSLPDNSPAIDAATDGYFSGFPFALWQSGCFDRSIIFTIPARYRNDQRGSKRPEGGACDIGAIEASVGHFYVIPLPNGKGVVFSL